MNCIWILLLLCCCGNGNNSCGNVRGSDNRCDHKHDCDCDCDCVREAREERREDRREERREERDRNSCERIVPPIRSDFATYSRNDRCEDNDYSRRSGDYDRRDRRCETCGCEAE